MTRAPRIACPGRAQLNAKPAAGSGRAGDIGGGSVLSASAIAQRARALMELEDDAEPYAQLS